MDFRSKQTTKISYKVISIDSIKIAYREAGETGNPILLLLHGFPSSSHMFRNVISKLAEHFHVIAPDLPAFGFSDVPSLETFSYTFENYATIVTHFLEKLKITKASFYLFDYGAPILMRLLIKRPEMIEMLIFQNGNIYTEGVGDVLKEVNELYKKDDFESHSKLKRFFEFDYTKWEYTNGAQDISNIAAETYFLDQFLMEREGVKEIQIELKRDYKTNVALYPLWQDFLKNLQPVTLIVWGENDEVFKKEGAEMLREDLDNSKLLFYPTGHFALEEFGHDIAGEIITYWYLNF
ncbi:pimeloyl-ACP methyl ester carboxylesterase [Flavobacterium sp. 90]|uniref:alpha/beta fold hydrolase n=1 Tax=unclassified Flavobacterium TaxID=196869 RepID=UPI000EB37557|nr:MULTISPECIES: alpha/beta hydrolase [unclassified Flavobacterium]RKR05076.1 pimeloyl-ACP methyl ester carboxylesterase [Flavobacterium sp. 81]TCK56392.1 pimeloyl-ACP methyl ester carboxylesterase [Flavobacterium sp. 90]